MQHDLEGQELPLPRQADCIGGTEHRHPLPVREIATRNQNSNCNREKVVVEGIQKVQTFAAQSPQSAKEGTAVNYRTLPKLGGGS
jgi:hypothetical protein